MSGRKLKNYGQYLQKIKNYAKALNIKVEWREEEENGAYIPTRRAIVLDPDMTDSETIAVFLHELGHATEFAAYTPKIDKFTDKAYSAKRPTRRQQRRIMDCERTAWNYGRVIAKKLRIRLGKWYDEHERDALNSYKTKPQNR